MSHGNVCNNDIASNSRHICHATFRLASTSTSVTSSQHPIMSNESATHNNVLDPTHRGAPFPTVDMDDRHLPNPPSAPSTENIRYPQVSISVFWIIRTNHDTVTSTSIGEKEGKPFLILPSWYYLTFTNKPLKYIRLLLLFLCSKHGEMRWWTPTGGRRNEHTVTDQEFEENVFFDAEIKYITTGPSISVNSRCRVHDSEGDVFSILPFGFGSEHQKRGSSFFTQPGETKEAKERRASNFRNLLLKRDYGRCVMSGTHLPPLLDATHVLSLSCGSEVRHSLY